MREIKFRVWDKSKQCYQKVSALYFPIPQDDDGAVAVGTFKHETLYSDNSIVEQYTGIKDENGKEICEGDIVSKRSLDYESGKPFGEPLIGAIVYKPDYLRFVLDVMSLHEVGVYPKYAQYEVIGNVHENPELLEEGYKDD